MSRNKHDNSLMKREDFFAGVRCNTVRGGKRNCDGFMHLSLASYYPGGPVFEELWCLKCNKTHRLKQVSKGRARERNINFKDFD